MTVASVESVEAGRLSAAVSRSGRAGLGFSSSSSSSSPSTEARRQLLTPASSSSSASTSPFSAASYLHRFGWKAGGGLGRREDGVSRCLTVSVREEKAGIGAAAGERLSGAVPSFETLYNNTARSVNIVVQPTSSDEDEQQQAAGASERKRSKKGKKRRRPAEAETGQGQDGAAVEAAPAAPDASLHRQVPGFRRGREQLLLSASASSASASASSSPSPSRSSLLSAVESAPAAAAESVLDTAALSPVFHHRCVGKLSRIRMQEERQQLIVASLHAANREEEKEDERPRQPEETEELRSHRHKKGEMKRRRRQENE